MRQIAMLVSVILALWASAARAEDPFSPPVTGPAAGVDTAQEQQKADEIAAQVAAGKYAEAVEAAKTFLRNAKDEALKSEVTRLVAESLRKTHEWKLAMGAYLKLRDRYEKGSDDYIRYDAMAEVLRASPAGVYAASAGDSAAGGSGGKTLADDSAVAGALAKVGEARLEKLKLRLGTIRRARGVSEVLAAFASLADELRQIRVLWPEMGPNVEREIAQAAGMRLAEFGQATVASLGAKKATFDAAIKAKRFNTSHRKDMEWCQGLCQEMAKAEESFVAVMVKMVATVDWAEGAQLRADSVQRQQEYEKLAPTFTPPPSRGRGDGDWRNSDWGSGAGGGGGGGGM